MVTHYENDEFYTLPMSKIQSFNSLITYYGLVSIPISRSISYNSVHQRNRQDILVNHRFSLTVLGNSTFFFYEWTVLDFRFPAHASSLQSLTATQNECKHVLTCTKNKPVK